MAVVFVAVIAFRSGLSLLPLVGVYMSVLVNVIVSPTLIGTLWRGKRHADSLMGNSRVGHAHLQYTRIIRTLVESALPPLALGLIHIVLLAAFQVVSPLFNLVWISSTVGHLNSRRSGGILSAKDPFSDLGPSDNRAPCSTEKRRKFGGNRFKACSDDLHCF